MNALRRGVCDVRDRLRGFGCAPLCNRRPERAPRIAAFVFPLCWRCTGLCVGGAVGCALRVPHGAAGMALGMLMLPLVIDAGLQELGLRPSTNGRRLVTGVLGGLAAHATRAFGA